MTASQPSQTQREVRTGLNNILHVAKERRHELGAGTGEQVAEILHQAQGFSGDINQPQEELIVSEILVIAAQTGHAVLKKLAQGGKSYTPADYVRNLKAHYVDDTDAQRVGAEDPSAFNWAAVGNSIAGWFKPAPHCYHMLGPMDAVAKAKRAVAQRRKKGPIAEAVRPDEVEVEGENQQETDRNMTTLYTLLKENEGCLFTDLVLNHNSFGQTVENVFAFSFLVRDRRVKLIESPEGIRVYKAAPPEKKKKRNRGGENNGGAQGEDDDAERFQFVITLDKEVWNAWREAVSEEDTLMPQREHHAEQEQGEQAAPARQQQRQNGRRRNQDDDGNDDGEEAAPVNKRGRPSK